MHVVTLQLLPIASHLISVTIITLILVKMARKSLLFFNMPFSLVREIRFSVHFSGLKCHEKEKVEIAKRTRVFF